jgi:hypothetical protein
MYLFLPDLKKIYSTLMALMATGEILLRPACVANLEKLGMFSAFTVPFEV